MELVWRHFHFLFKNVDQEEQARKAAVKHLSTTHNNQIKTRLSTTQRSTLECETICFDVVYMNRSQRRLNANHHLIRAQTMAFGLCVCGVAWCRCCCLFTFSFYLQCANVSAVAGLFVSYRLRLFVYRTGVRVYDVCCLVFIVVYTSFISLCPYYCYRCGRRCFIHRKHVVGLSIHAEAFSRLLLFLLLSLSQLRYECEMFSRAPVYFCFNTAGVDKFFVGVSYLLIHRPFFHSIRWFFFQMCPCDIYYKMLLIFS